MKYGPKEISELDDNVLLAAYNNCRQVRERRNKARKHDKFNKDNWGSNANKKKLEFPPINPEFEKLETEIKNELAKRNLENWT